MSDAVLDLAIIGAGPGGYTAAIRAAQHGLKVALIEEKDPGGVCLHTGCIPTKAMLASAGVLRQARAAAQWGVEVTQAQTALAAITDRRRKIVQQLAAGVKNLLEKNQVRTIRGRAHLRSAREIVIEDAARQSFLTLLNPGAILLASGSRPAELPVAPRDGTVLLNSDDLLMLTELPAELLIIGGGYIGCEFATLFSTLGSRVTIVEAMDRLLPGLDRDLGQALARAFARTGINVLLHAKIQEAVPTSSGVEMRLAGGQPLRADKALVAVGRVPNVERLGLETAGVGLEAGFVAVNPFMETSAPRVYAIGDLTGRAALAHVATAQARLVVENLMAAREGRGPVAMNYAAVPMCVFTDPEIASVGLTEAEAAERGMVARVGRFHLAALGKALAAGETEGFVKLVADAGSGRLVGGQVFGHQASELIGQITLAVHLGAGARQLAETIVAHPTLSEAIHEAAEALFGRPVHAFTRR